MTLLYFIILLIFKVKCQTNVQNIKANDIKEYLSTSDYLVLYFFQDICGECSKVNSLFQEAVSQLSSSDYNIKFGKVDCTDDKEILKMLDIASLPTIRIFNVARNTHFDYIGGWDVRKVVKFLFSHLNKDIRKINNLKWLENNMKINLVLCGQTAKTEKLLEKINEIISAKDNIELLFAEGEEIQKYLNCNYNELSLLMVKPSEERLVKFEGKFSTERIEEWINIYSLPVLIDLNEENFETSMHLQKPLIFLLTQSEETEFESKLRSYINEKAKEHRGKAVFLYSKNTTFFTNRLLISYNDNGKLPLLFSLVTNQEGTISKYLFQDKMFDNAKIDQWIIDLTNNNCTKYIKSEEIPQKPLDGYLNLVVGKTFNDTVLNNDKDVLLEISSTWDDESKKLDVKFKRIAEKLRNNKNLIVARMDGIKNEYEDVQLTNLPTVLLFKGGNKTNKEKLSNRIKFEGKFNVSAIIEFVKNNSFHNIKDIQMVPNESLLEQEEMLLEIKDIMAKEMKDEREETLINFEDIERMLNSNRSLENSTFELTEEDLIEDDQEEEEYEKRKKLREDYDARFEEL